MRAHEFLIEKNIKLENGVSVFENPTTSQLHALTKNARYNLIRGMVLLSDNKRSLYVWPAYDMRHADFINEFRWDPHVDFLLSNDEQNLQRAKEWRYEPVYESNGFYFSIYSSANLTANRTSILSQFSPFNKIKLLYNEEDPALAEGLDDLMQTNSGLVEGPVVNGRIVPRLSDGTMPSVLYRIMSKDEYDAGMSSGRFMSKDGRVHADIVPHFEYAEPGSNNVLVSIQYNDDDGWKAKWTADKCIAITNKPIPADRIAVLASGKRNDLENSNYQSLDESSSMLSEINLIPDLDDEYNADEIANTSNKHLKKVGKLGPLTLYICAPLGLTAPTYFFGKNKKILGQADVYRDARINRHNTVTVKHIWFDPSIRGQGYGMKFYEYLLQHGNNILADSQHTNASQGLWTALARKYKVYPLLDGNQLGQPITDLSNFYSRHVSNTNKLIALAK